MALPCRIISEIKPAVGNQNIFNTPPAWPPTKYCGNGNVWYGNSRMATAAYHKVMFEYVYLFLYSKPTTCRVAYMNVTDGVASAALCIASGGK